MNTNSIRATALTTIAAAIMVTGIAAPVQAAGPASFDLSNAVFQSEDAQIVLAGGRHRGGKRHGRKFRHGHGHGGWHGHYGYHKPYHGGCFWRKKRFWDGYGYYYRKFRVCY